jgi:hypothetical protein
MNLQWRDKIFKLFERLVRGFFYAFTSYNSNNLLVQSKHPFIMKTNCLQKYSVLHCVIKIGKKILRVSVLLKWNLDLNTQYVPHNLVIIWWIYFFHFRWLTESEPQVFVFTIPTTYLYYSQYLWLMLRVVHYTFLYILLPTFTEKLSAANRNYDTSVISTVMGSDKVSV